MPPPQSQAPTQAPPQSLTDLDHQHLWHPFTPMRQWRQSPPLIIEQAQGEYLTDTHGRRYIDGVSSLWCNVHGHRVPKIDQAIRDQLDKVAHTTLLGLASPPSIELAQQLAEITPGQLNKVFYTDAGATAVEVALKMAVGYWHHNAQPAKNTFIAFSGAYHGDTTGSMSIGYSELFHHAFRSMVFPVQFVPAPNACHPPPGFAPANTPLPTRPNTATPNHPWPSEDPSLTHALKEHCLAELDRHLQQHAHHTAGIVIEPVMQGAAGMICQPPGFVRGVADLARKHSVLLIADEVATGFGRTGKMFACEHDLGEDFQGPDIMCLAKGITGGYLPLAATITTDAVEQAFCGQLADRRTLYHGHTYTGNPLACAAALASLDLFKTNQLLDHINQSAAIFTERLNALRDTNQFPHVADIRQRGLMVGIELAKDRQNRQPFDPTQQIAAKICLSMRPKGLIIRPLGNVIILMPIPAMPHDSLIRMLNIVTESIRDWQDWPTT